MFGYGVWNTCDSELVYQVHYGYRVDYDTKKLKIYLNNLNNLKIKIFKFKMTDGHHVMLAIIPQMIVRFSQNCDRTRSWRDYVNQKGLRMFINLLTVNL